METGSGYYGHVAITAGAVRGRAPLEPALEIELKIQADGFAPGVAAMILASCQVQGARLPADLGQAETIITQLGFAPRDGGDTPYVTRVFARWRLTQASVEHLEHVRNGGNLLVFVTPEVVLLNHGESLPGIYPRPEGVHRPNVNPHSPIWHAGQEQLHIPADTWAREVLTPWQQAAAVTLVVKLPEGTATDDHRTVIRDLTDARQRLDAGDWKGSIRASRDAAEVLRSMHDEHLNPKKTQRDVDEREAAILDAERQLIQSLFDYGSATHPDPTLRATVWTREHAMLVLATATAVAQRLFQPRSPGNHSDPLPGACSPGTQRSETWTREPLNRAQVAWRSRLPGLRHREGADYPKASTISRQNALLTSNAGPALTAVVEALP